MNSYKERLVCEYKELKDRYRKLHKLLVKHDAGTLGFSLNCPAELLKEQKAAMGRYLNILEIRAEAEGIELEDCRLKRLHERKADNGTL